MSLSSERLMEGIHWANIRKLLKLKRFLFRIVHLKADVSKEIFVPTFLGPVFQGFQVLSYDKFGISCKLKVPIGCQKVEKIRVMDPHGFKYEGSINWTRLLIVSEE